MNTPGSQPESSPGPNDEGAAKTRGDSSRRTVTVVIIVALVILVVGVAVLRSSDDGSSATSPASGSAVSASPGSAAAATKAKVTFVELGSTTCAPCKAMQPVMADVEKTFGDQVEVIFYDVNEDSAPAEQYGIQYIPTQVFLDESGQEFHRHTGFYSYEDIEALLLEQGLTKASSL